MELLLIRVLDELSQLRIAISGTHAVGKSTLIADIGDACPAFRVIDEPYHELVDEGHLFPERPSADDFVVQLERSIHRLSTERGSDILFDRCPADFLAYLTALGAHNVVREWLSEASDALRALDLVVVVPIEHPDLIATTEGPALRRRVDVVLQEILIEDSLSLGVRYIRVQGSRDERMASIIAAIGGR